MEMGTDEESGEDEDKNKESGDEGKKAATHEVYLSMIEKMDSVDDIIGKMDKRSVALSKTVQCFMESLEFSQGEISDLKKENAELRKKVGKLEIEDKHRQFQVSMAEEKLD